VSTLEQLVAPRRRRLSLPRVRAPRGARLIDLLVAGAVVLTVGAPMFFTDNGFSQDFTNDLWLIWVAGHHFGHTLWPSYFLNVNPPAPNAGVFNPEFAFYGGPVFTAAGALSALLFDHAIVAYALVTALALAAAYGGCWWLARQCGVRGLLTHVPPTVLLTSAYYVTDLYGRGAWAEFMAVSSIPPMVASAVHLVRAPRWRVSSALALVASVFVFTGAHNITLEWGSIVLTALALALFAAYRPSWLPWRRVLAVGCLGLVSAGVNGWFLLPDIVYANRTLISGAGFDWAGSSGFDKLDVVLNPLRMVPSQSSTPALYIQAPVWFMVWGLIVGMWLWRDAAMARLRRAWAIVVVGVAVVLWLMLFEWPWEHVPSALQDIQFPYRLASYVTLLSVGIVIVAALAMQRLAARSQSSVGRLWSLRTLLVQAIVVSVLLCLWQLWVPNTHQSSYYAVRGRALKSLTEPPKTWGSGPDYSDRWLLSTSVPANRSLTIDAGAVDAAGNHASVVLAAPPGPGPIATNILAGPYLVDVRGVNVVGHSPSGLVVTRLHGSTGKVRLVLSTQSSRAVTLGRAITVASVLAALLLLGWLAIYGSRGRRARSTLNGSAPGDS
jgi:hypothetical protein